MGTVAQLWDWNSDRFWLAAAAIAQILMVISIPTSIWLYRKEDRLAREQFQRAEREKFYVQLNEMYLSILQMVVQNPKLQNASRNSTESEQIQYDSFAFIMWNFIETIFDFCLDEEMLRKTWHCILETESAAHADWFNRPENRRKFKKEFCDYIDRFRPNSTSVTPPLGTAANEPKP